MNDNLELLVEDIKSKYSIDLNKYKNKEVSVKIGELIIFPEYVVKNILIGGLVGSVAFLLSFLFLDFSLIHRIIYIFLGSTLWFITGIFFGLILFLLKLKLDLNKVISYAFYLTDIIIDDVSKLGKKLNKKEILELFKAVVTVVLLPSLSDAISNRIPLIGNSVNNSIKKIINKTIKKVKFDSDKNDVKNSNTSIEFNSKNFIEKLKIKSIGIMNSSLKIIQFPIRIISLSVTAIALILMFGLSN
ncbi:hypothetical protein N9764_06210 [Polaribacter sp.]|nr:hypothetical protein [Polaribacter sp.]